jgi:hypothetical protein
VLNADKKAWTKCKKIMLIIKPCSIHKKPTFRDKNNYSKENLVQNTDRRR